jgi:hypothetical protein
MSNLFFSLNLKRFQTLWGLLTEALCGASVFFMFFKYEGVTLHP